MWIHPKTDGQLPIPSNFYVTSWYLIYYIRHTADNGPSGFKSKHLDFCLEYIYMQSTKLYLSKENSTSGILSKSLLKKLKKSSAFTGLKWNLNFVSRLLHASHGFLTIFCYSMWHGFQIFNFSLTVMENIVQKSNPWVNCLTVKIRPKNDI